MTDLSFLPEADRAKVSERLAKWNKAMMEGVLVDLHITEWSGQTTLTDEDWQALGVALTDESARDSFHRVMRGGRFELVPHEAIQTIRSASGRARTLLNMFAIDVWAGRLILATSYDEWKQATERAEEAFRQGITYLLDNLYEGDKLVDKQINEYRRVFDSTWRQLSQIGVVTEAREVFIERAIQSILRSIPSPDDIRRRYTWEVELSYAPSTVEVAEEAQRAAEARAVAITTDAFVAQQTAQIRADIAARETERMQHIMGSLEQAERQYYHHLSTTLAQAKESLEGKTGVPPQTSKQIRCLLDYAKRANVLGDNRVEKMIEDCLSLVREDARQEKGATVADLQATIAKATNSIAAKMRAIPKYTGRRIVAGEEDGGVARKLVSRAATDDNMELGGARVLARRAG